MNQKLSVQNSNAGWQSPASIVGIYLVVGILWLPFSNWLLALWNVDDATFGWIRDIKGGLFVLITAGLLYWLIRRSTKTLWEERTLLRAIIDGASEAIFLKDAQGRYVLVNSAGIRDTGKASAEEVIGRTDAELFPTEIAQPLREKDHQIMASGKSETCEEVVRAVGETRTYSVTKAPYRNAEGRITGVIGIARDITEGKRQESLLAGEKRILEMIATDAALAEVLAAITRLFEEQVREEAFCSVLLLDAEGRRLKHGAAPSLPESYNRAIDGNAIGPAVGSCGTAVYRGETVIVADIATDPLWKDHRELALRHGLRACWSVPICSSKGKVLGTFAIYYPEPRTPAVSDLEFIDRATHLTRIAMERQQAEEALQRTHEELERRVRERTAGLTRAIVDLQEEIHKRERTEAALRESEERFRQLAEHIRDVFWITSLDSKRVIYVSPAYEEIWGRSREDLSENAEIWLDTLHPEDRERVQDALLKAGINGDFRQEYRIIRPDGAIRWIRDRGFPVQDDAGCLYRIAGIAEDITEAKRLQEQMQRQQVELSHIGRLSLAGEMASGLAHELNQPLTAIATLADTCALFIRSEQPSTEAVVEMLEKISVQAQRAGEIIRRIKDFTRKTTPEHAPLEIHLLLQEVIGLLEHEIRQREVVMRLDVSDTLPPVMGDNIQIQQVILNLAHNAIEAMQETAEKHELIFRVQAADNDTLEVAISDTGPGLSAEASDHLFHPFFTTKADGMGLGLSISKSIIEAHGGRLWATGHGEQGSTFHFTLPTSAPHSQVLKQA